MVITTPTTTGDLGSNQLIVAELSTIQVVNNEADLSDVHPNVIPMLVSIESHDTI